MKTLIVLNQPHHRVPVDKYDFIVGVDGGCKWCIKQNLLINLAIGDFDSLEEPYLSQLADYAIDIESHPQDKDLTDLELAIHCAMNHEPSLLTVYGVWGGQMDHMLANVLCLSQQTKQTPVIMPGNEQSGYLIKNQQKLIINTEPGTLVSLLAIGSDCTGLSNSGFKYPLDKTILKVGTGFGLSNVTTHKHSEINLESGELLVLIDSKIQVEIKRSEN